MEFINFGRSTCSNLAAAETKEWLVTNGIGGYASGTVANVLTRRYHGSLVAALQPPLGRILLVAKLDESVAYAGQATPLYANRWADDIIDPLGFLHLERFHLEGAIPVWSFSFADALLQKRIWMQQGENTTYIQYRLVRAGSPLELTAKALVNYRDVHSATSSGDWRMQVEEVKNGLRIHAFEDAVPCHILCSQAVVKPRHEWYRNYELSAERYRGLSSSDDHLHAGDFQVSLEGGQAVTFVLTTHQKPDLDGENALLERKTYEKSLIELAPNIPAQLCLAADKFIARRSTATDPTGKTILAGYHWFGDWGRDTMISLPGLTLVTNRPDAARSILLTFSKYVNQGMLPNRFPDNGETPEYNTVDATLWYVEAIRAYLSETGDLSSIGELYPVLESIIDWHIRGTRYNIKMDPSDGLLAAGQNGVQLTWMDAKVGDWVVTPRIGKPIEINALWYNALLSMAGFSQQLGKNEGKYKNLARSVRAGFNRFWNEAGGYLYDVIDGPQAYPQSLDASLRPNQLFAVSLTHSPLNKEQQKAVVDTCARHLLTSHGLRSLAQHDAAYIGHYGGGMRQRDAAYHQGTVWAWLIGPFISAHLKVYQDPQTARTFLEPFIRHLSDHGLGSVSEIFDGDAPFTARGCIAQAWSVAELLRGLREIEGFEK